MTSDVTQDDESEDANTAPSDNPLVWKEVGGGQGQLYQANAIGSAVYSITPDTEEDRWGRLRWSDDGYSVTHWPALLNGPFRYLAVGVETIEEAKAIAQADYDEDINEDLRARLRAAEASASR